MNQILMLASAATLAFAAPALANPGHGNGHGQGNPHAYGYNGPVGYGIGGCPPGLAKKNNGCLPPGQAKKMWAVGQPLPSSVYYEPLPPMLLGRLSPAPAGYQYVRVASDVLMLAVGTRMVTAAIADPSRLNFWLVGLAGLALASLAAFGHWWLGRTPRP